MQDLLSMFNKDELDTMKKRIEKREASGKTTSEKDK